MLAVPPSPNTPVELARIAIKAVRARWMIVLGAGILGLVMGVGLAFTMGKQTWEATGVMLYSPPPIPESQKGLYLPPDLATLVPLAKSPELLTGLAEEFELPVPASLLDKLFKVTAPRGTQSVVVSFSWAEPGKAAEMTNRFMSRVAEQTREQRYRKAQGYLSDFEDRLKATDERQAEAVKAYQEFLRKHNVFDLQGELEATRKAIETAQAARANAMRDEAAYVAQRERMTVELDSFRKQTEQQNDAEKKYEAEMESVADSRRRQDRLRELIDEEKQRQELLAELATKRKTYDRLLALRESGAIAPTELEAMQRDIQVLSAKLTDSEQVQKWKQELAKIDAAVVPKNRGSASGSPIVQQALFRRLELDLKLVGIQKEMIDADRELATQRHRLSELQAMALQSDSMAKDLEAIAADRSKLSEQIAFFTRLRDLTAPEFLIVTPARSSPYPVSSNRKMFVLAGLMLGGCLGLGFALFRGWQDSHHGGRQTALRANLPVYGPIAREDLPALRQIASATRDWLPTYGAGLLLTSDEGPEDPFPWAVRLACRLAAIDERILIIDTRIGELATPMRPEGLGLGEYLTFEADDLNELRSADLHPGVDLLPAGYVGSVDLLASHRMRELMTDLRKRYSMILLVGPAVNRVDGIDLLSRFAEGTLVVLSAGSDSDTEAPRLINLQKEHPEQVRGLVVQHDE